MTVRDPWLLSSKDAIIDDVALSVATTGQRQVRLTARERDISALIIQHDYRQGCRRDGTECSAEALVTLVFVYLSLPSRLAASRLILALPAGRKGSHLVDYWTGRVYRQCEANRRARARQLSRIAGLGETMSRYSGGLGGNSRRYHCPKRRRRSNYKLRLGKRDLTKAPLMDDLVRLRGRQSSDLWLARNPGIRDRLIALRKGEAHIVSFREARDETESFDHARRYQERETTTL